LIITLLLSPILSKHKKFEQLPIIAIAIDNSLSIKNEISTIESIKKTLENSFSKEYQLEFWSFGEKLEQKIIDGSERRSDYGQMIKTINVNYTHKNIGSLILIGDGIFNQGQNPIDLSSNLSFPIYTIGIGDTTLITDAAIRNVKTNRTTFVNNKFPVEIELNFGKLKNKLATIEIENNGIVVYSSVVAITSDDQFILELANLEAKSAGLQHYTIKVSKFENEKNFKNNIFEFAIRVVENKQKILLLSDGPHPDLGAIRNSLNSIQSYDSEIITGNQLPDSINQYSLIIFNQLPSVKNSSIQAIEMIKRYRIPTLFIIGSNTLLEVLNTFDLGLRFVQGNNYEEVQASFNPDFSLFKLSDEAVNILSEAPPLISPFGDVSFSPNLQTLFTQNIKKIKTTKVLIALGNDKGRKIGFINGEGIWLWRLNNYQISNNHDSFDELILKIVQYLSLKENDDNFMVYHPAIFQETDEIELIAELYNDSYELVNSPEISITITNDQLDELNFNFDRITDHYRLNAGNLQAGDYKFKAEVQLGTQVFIENGVFSVVKNETELQNSRADFKMLYQLAHQSGGQFYTFNNFGTLVADIQNNQQIVSEEYRLTETNETINLKFLFFLMVIMMSVEWFLRKFWGIY
jgi:hypothetical protein